MTESASASTSKPAGAARTTVTVDAGVSGSARSQESAWLARTCSMAVASASVSQIAGSALIWPSRIPPRARAYQATPCRHPVLAPRGVVVQPSSSTAAPGAAAAKSSLGQPGVPGSVASSTRICLRYRVALPVCRTRPAYRAGWSGPDLGRSVGHQFEFPSLLVHGQLVTAGGGGAPALRA